MERIFLKKNFCERLKRFSVIFEFAVLVVAAEILYFHIETTFICWEISVAKKYEKAKLKLLIKIFN